MITKKFLSSFIKNFERSKDSDNEWNSKLFEKCDSSSWGEVLLSRSEHLRKNFEENDSKIKELENMLQDELSDKEYRLVADAALKIYQDGYDDIRVFSLLLDTCIPHFKEIGDYDYLLPLLHAYAFEYEQVDPYFEETPKYGYEDIIVYKDEYANISSRYARLSIVKAYSNLISRVLYEEEKDSFGKMVSMYKEFRSVWEKDEVQKLDGEDEEFLYFCDRMLQSICLYENIDVLSEEETSFHEQALLEALKNKELEFYPLLLAMDEVRKNHKGEIDNEECADYLIHHFDETFSKLNKDMNGDERLDCIDDCYNIIDSMSAYLNGPRAVSIRKGKILNRMRSFWSAMKSLPYDFYNNEMNNYFPVVYQKLKDYMSFKQKKEYLFEIIMFRQPITCIHSLMVEAISEAIAKKILKQKPELFLGVNGYNDIGEIEWNEDEVISFIKECALFHDVGKVSMVGIINMQNRRLSDMEFKRLKKHADGGVRFLGEDKDFAKYFDVMCGHHKWYDGKGGYPSSFDNLLSPIKNVIDLVTIADCTDAATDILGRNYSKGKSFLAVLEEFKAGAGTRYNPEIVSLIEQDQRLIEELSRLTTEGRMEVYKRVYSKYIHEA